MMERRHSFNVAVSALMTLSNVLQDCSSTMAGSAEYHMALSTLTVLLAPMAPHMASELWSGESTPMYIHYMLNACASGWLACLLIPFRAGKGACRLGPGVSKGDLLPSAPHLTTIPHCTIVPPPLQS